MTLDRKKLGFIEAVLEKFQFLVNQYSYRCSFKDIYLVCYESKDVIVCIYHERLSYELYLEISLKQTFIPNISVMLNDFLNLVGIKDRRAEFLQASSRESVFTAVSILAELTQRYAESVLLGDKSAFEAIGVMKKELLEKQLKIDRINEIENIVSVAWKNRDFAQVVQLYSQVEDLSELQKKRLEYARSKRDK